MTLLARVCVLTPNARGAVSVVRVWGRDALEVADRVFRPVNGVSLARSTTDRPRFGRVGAGEGDEVVAVVMDQDVEIHCHGGPEPVALVVAALVEAGAERRQPVAWVRHSSRSLVSAEALVDLARAPTVRTAEILLEQVQGALEQELAEVVRQIKTDRSAAVDAVEQLLERGEVGRRLINGWRVALVGRPNVGKSRLLNALAGYERAIVDPTPGTTRDVVTVQTALDGWPIEIADTAGLRDSEDPIEAAGIALARARQTEADLTLLVLDRSEPLTTIDDALRDAEIARGGLVIANKSDLPPVWVPESGIQVVSAASGEGLDRLARLITGRLVPKPPTPGVGLPFRPVHLRRLVEVREALRAGEHDRAAAILSVWLAEQSHSDEPSGRVVGRDGDSFEV